MSPALQQKIREAQKRITHLQLVLPEIKRELDDIVRSLNSEQIKTS